MLKASAAMFGLKPQRGMGNGKWEGASRPEMTEYICFNVFVSSLVREFTKLISLFVKSNMQAVSSMRVALLGGSTGY